MYIYIYVYIYTYICIYIYTHYISSALLELRASTSHTLSVI